MEAVMEEIGQLFTKLLSEQADRIEKIPQSGSDRVYFRIYTSSKTYIATYNTHQKKRPHLFISASILKLQVFLFRQYTE